MTPADLAKAIVAELPLTATSRVLEPSFGDGAFLLPLIERLMALQDGSESERLARVLQRNLWGVEIDHSLYQRAVGAIEDRFGPLPEEHNLQLADFFSTEFMVGMFDVVVGNPPYGGTFDPKLEDGLDRLYGRWNGFKLKKETYSFFVARSLDWLIEGGCLAFIISDTMLTISTMAGLRERLLDTTQPSVDELRYFSSETTQPTLVLRALKCAEGATGLVRNGEVVDRSLIASTGNRSWAIDRRYADYFAGPALSEYVVCTSGMTIGNNELFLREIVNGRIREPFDFEFVDEPITLEGELSRARLHKLSSRKTREIIDRESAGDTRRTVRPIPQRDPADIELPHSSYKYYNKADGGVVYTPPKWAIYWKDEGDAVITYKKSGNWYLHGVGGKRFFGREGLTWHLVSSRLKMRYLPTGYILDSGAPCAFLRDNINEEELWFILGWCLTDAATDIIKTVINHTRNIQSKDVERLPYPWWVAADAKATAIESVEKLVAEARASGRQYSFNDPEVRTLGDLYRFGGIQA